MQEKGERSFAQLRVGWLLEVRVRRLTDEADVDALLSQIATEIARAARHVVLCADCRHAAPVSRAVSHSLSRAMRQVNRSILRSAILLDPANTMFNLQLDRVVRCALNPARRTFRDFDDLRAWVGAALPHAQRAALADLFSARDT